MPKLKATLSEKSPYWISRHRYYELKHFCLQYHVWEKELAENIDYPYTSMLTKSFVKNSKVSDPTADAITRTDIIRSHMEMVKSAAKETDSVLGDYIFYAVINGISYDILCTRVEVPCSRDCFYELYRKFFSILDKKRM